MKLLKDLISINSVSGKEEEILEFINNALAGYGLNPFYVPGGLALCIKGKQNKKALIFNAHVDTVPPGDTSLWKTKPFKAKKIGNKVYGLGASDEKAAATSLILLAKKLSKEKPECDVWFSFVKNEEKDGSGTKQFIDWFCRNNEYKQIGAVLGEPTNLKRIEIAHKGNCFVRIKVSGISGHGSTVLDIKKQAVKKAIIIIQQIDIMANDWANKYSDKLLGKPTAALTGISSGNFESPNKYPEICELMYDIRTTPKLHNKVLKLLKTDLKKFNLKIEYLYDPAPFGYTQEDSEIVKVAKKLKLGKVGVSSSSNDLCFFTQKNIPGIVYGPGNPGVIHKPNEWCEIGKVVECIHDYQQIIYTYSKFDLTTKISGDRFIP